jgi:serine/threonine protein kinase
VILLPYYILIQEASIHSSICELAIYDHVIKPSSTILPYSPFDNIILNNYKIEKTIYHDQLSASTILLATDIEHNQTYAIKQISKEKLSNYYMHTFVKNEMTLQYSLCRISDNIVKVPAYFEDETKYSLVMEYSQDPCYFENMLENV